MFIAVILDLLSICSLIGAYAVNYFTVRKIGMLRWVNYYTNHFQKACPAATVKLALSLLLLLGVCLLLLACRKRWALFSPARKAGVFLMLIPLAVHFFCLFRLSVKTTRAIYFILLLTGFSVLLQMFKVLLSLKQAGKNRAD